MQSIRKQKLKAIDLAFFAQGAVILAICSWISIPTAIPFTLQTFGIFCVLGILGGKRGLFSILVYILMGAVGVPVFSGFSGGFGVILGPTGGYIIGFILAGLLYWLLETLLGIKPYIRVISMLAGLSVCYVFGTGWFVLVYSAQTDPVSFSAALTSCVIPFIIPDLIKIGLAVLVTYRVERYIPYVYSFRHRKAAQKSTRQDNCE